MSTQVDLTNCDQEPIHIPGAIQPHGALLAFDDQGRLVMASANAEALLGPLPALGSAPDDTHLFAELRTTVRDAIHESRLDAVALNVNDRVYDAVLHRSEGHLVVELEARPANSPSLENFALSAQRAIGRLSHDGGLEKLLDDVVREVRTLTGFDRVMAYRFQPDDSGLVAAEARRDDLEPFLGLRYPASDIPAQARRLYTISPLRLIADVAYKAVPIVPTVSPLTKRPLDLSHSVLRSVSPIHVEYLTNMGVQASMSISIVVNNKLWGLIACHHMSPLLVPHAVRMACNLLAQVVSVLVTRGGIAEEMELRERTLGVQLQLLQRLTAGVDPVRDLTEGSPNVTDLIASDGAAVILGGELATTGKCPPDDAIRDLADWVRTTAPSSTWSTFEVHADVTDEKLVAQLEGTCGVLVAPFFLEHNGLILWFRGEEVETVRWGGNPDKVYREGPLGPRLSPRGSFKEWRQVVQGRARPWSAVELSSAERLRLALQENSLSNARSRIGALEKVNEELERVTYVVSHDLRSPLRAIGSLNDFIEEELKTNNVELALQHVQTMRTRVLRLDSLILAILSYARSGQSKQASREVDVGALVKSAIDLVGIPSSVSVEVTTPMPRLFTQETPLQQVFMNLIGNALKYGTRDGAGRIEISARDRGGAWEFSVKDEGPGIAPEYLEKIWALFSRIHTGNDGTGIGLAVVRRIVDAQGGRVWVRSTPGEGATFSFSWPDVLSNPDSAPK